MSQQTETRRLVCIRGSENEKLHDERERFKEFKDSKNSKIQVNGTIQHCRAKSKGCKAFKKFIRAGHSKDQPTERLIC